MDHVDDLDSIGANTIDQDIIGMDNGLACPVDPTCAIQKRMFRKSLCTVFDSSK